MKILLFIIFSVLFTTEIQGFSDDETLEMIIQAYDLPSSHCGSSNQLFEENTDLIELGKLFFNTKELSGQNDTSCASCHHSDRSFTDGLPVAVGVNNFNSPQQPTYESVLVLRNAPTLFGRADKNFINYFWDGKVQLDGNQIVSPIGLQFKDKLNSLLSAASILPFLSRDEFLGRHHLVKKHLVTEVDPLYYSERFDRRNSLLKKQLQSKESSLSESLRKLGVSPKKVDLVDIGNALAHFIQSLNSVCEKSGWEKYIEGNTDALSPTQKEGAILFYGKGRCAACHGGSYFSDFQFHSIGLPKFEYGPYLFNDDIGLAETTYQLSDRYKFRTPPLIKVSKSAPYGHNGIFKELKDIIYYHISPVIHFRNKPIEQILNNSQILESRSDLLRHIRLNDSEIDLIVDFLSSI